MQELLTAEGLLDKAGDTRLNQEDIIAFFVHYFQAKIDSQAVQRFQEAIQAWLAAFKLVDIEQAAKDQTGAVAIVLDASSEQIQEAGINRLVAAWNNMPEERKDGVHIYFTTNKTALDIGKLKSQVEQKLESRGLPTETIYGILRNINARHLTRRDFPGEDSPFFKMNMETIYSFVARQTGKRDIFVEVITDDTGRFEKTWRENLRIILYQISSQTQLILVPRMDESIRDMRILSVQA